MKTITAGRARREVPESVHDRICPQCGRLFTCWDLREWCYHIGERYYCTWTCVREAERGIKPHQDAAAQERWIPDASPHRQHNQHFNQAAAIEQAREIVKLRDEGLTYDQIAMRMNLTVSVVCNRLQKHGREVGWVPMGKREAAQASVEKRRRKRKKKAPEAGASGEKDG